MTATAPLIQLASQSPRRQALLEQLGVPFEIVYPGVEELPEAGESPEVFVIRLALAKARAGYALRRESRVPVLGADTVVLLDEEVLS